MANEVLINKQTKILPDIKQLLASPLASMNSYSKRGKGQKNSLKQSKEDSQIQIQSVLLSAYFNLTTCFIIQNRNFWLILLNTFGGSESAPNEGKDYVMFNRIVYYVLLLIIIIQSIYLSIFIYFSFSMFPFSMCLSFFLFFLPTSVSYKLAFFILSSLPSLPLSISPFFILSRSPYLSLGIFMLVCLFVKPSTSLFVYITV